MAQQRVPVLPGHCWPRGIRGFSVFVGQRPSSGLGWDPWARCRGPSYAVPCRCLPARNVGPVSAWQCWKAHTTCRLRHGMGSCTVTSPVISGASCVDQGIPCLTV
jgi:hypothetical protein